MKKHTSIIFFLGCLTFGFISYNFSIDKIVESANDYFANRPMEQVYLHLDKPYYTSGDRIWYKAYLLDYQTNRPSDLSQILHIELQNSLGYTIVSQKIPLSSGLGDGYMDLPDTLSRGNYRLTAYTKWMLNFDQSLNFDRTIKVVASTNEPVGLRNEETFKVSFYPEGGQVLENKLIKIAFKANLRQPVKGYLVDEGEKFIQDISSDSLGIGSFLHVPKPEKTYIAKFFWEEDTVNFFVPKAKAKGTIMRIEEKGANYNIYAECTSDFNNQKAYLIVQHKGKVSFAINGQFKSNGLLVRLPKEQMPKGLVHVTLFGGNGDLLNERLIYNYEKSPKSKLQIKGEKEYSTRQQVKLDVSLIDVNSADLSVAVVSKKFFGSYKNMNIVDFFKLMSGTDITEIPSNESIDNLMLTSTMKAYSWRSILNNDEPDFQYPIAKRGLFEVSGSLLNVSGKLNNNTYSITLTGQSPEFYFDQLERDGTFNFNIPSFYGKRDLIIKPYAINDLASDLSYKLDRVEFEFENTNHNPQADSTQIEYARTIRENKVIRKVYGQNYEKKKDKIQDESTTFSILRAPDATIRLEDYIQLPTMKEVASEILEGVRISQKKDGTYKVQMRSIDDVSGYFMDFNKEEPLMFIDGLPVYNSKHIAELNPLEVESIDMKYGQYKLSGIEFKGIISIHTVERNYAETNDLSHGLFTLNGFLEPYAFDVPVLDERSPDFRPLLYWSPDVSIVGNNEASVSFVTSDDTGDYIVDIQGISSEGEALFAQYVINVKK